MLGHQRHFAGGNFMQEDIGISCRPLAPQRNVGAIRGHVGRAVAIIVLEDHFA